MQPLYVCDNTNVRVYGDYVAMVKRCKLDGWVWYAVNVVLPKGHKLIGYESFSFGADECFINQTIVGTECTLDDDRAAWDMAVKLVEALSV